MKEIEDVGEREREIYKAKCVGWERNGTLVTGEEISLGQRTDLFSQKWEHRNDDCVCI